MSLKYNKKNLHSEKNQKIQMEKCLEMSTKRWKKVECIKKSKNLFLQDANCDKEIVPLGEWKFEKAN